ncbi:putative alpha/Beta hydrolase [Helianthus anomalus]
MLFLFGSFRFQLLLLQSFFFVNIFIIFLFPPPSPLATPFIFAISNFSPYSILHVIQTNLSNFQHFSFTHISHIIYIFNLLRHHCLDLQTPNDTDPDWLKAQRNVEINMIDGWLSEYKIPNAN